jgi:hypothetical protein
MARRIGKVVVIGVGTPPPPPRVAQLHLAQSRPAARARAAAAAGRSPAVLTARAIAHHLASSRNCSASKELVSRRG